MGVTVSITTTGLIARAIMSPDRLDRAAAEDLAVLLAGVQRAIFCPYTSVLLDIRTAVMITLPEARPTIMAGNAWDRISADIIAAYPLIIIVDGRDYRADGKLTAVARKRIAATCAKIVGE